MNVKRMHDFVEENMKTIFAYALSRVSNIEDAEDLASEIMIAILGCTDRIKNDEAMFGYVWKIAANTYKKFLRKKSRSRAAVEYDDNILNSIPAEDDFTDTIARAEQFNSLRREMSLLSKEYRECTVAYYFDGLSCAQTSERLGISLEMVKYYLFKTRKLLKEGIGMEREFGEKSYKPSRFDFVTIFSGQFNREYRNLFNRRLPGNILLSAYYTPMTIRELSVELGVASAYMEDEVALLEKYRLLTPMAGGKYQTNLVIFTEGYTREFNKTASEAYTDEIGQILRGVKSLLPEIRAVGFRGNGIADRRMLWALLWLVMHRGHTFFEKSGGAVAPDIIYDGATGINYGIDYDENGLDASSDEGSAGEYSCPAFAGYSEIDDRYFASFADFGVLPQKNRYSCHNDVVKAALCSGDDSYAVFTQTQVNKVAEILDSQVKAMASLYEKLTDCAVRLMKIHAPKNVEGLVEKIVTKTIFFRTAGLIGKCAVNSGELTVPQDDAPVAVFICETTEEDRRSVNKNCQA